MPCYERKLTPRDQNSKTDLIVRLNKINGQINGIKKMIEDDRYCDDILIQLSAVSHSIKSIANLVLDEHMHTCLVEHIKNDNLEEIDNLLSLIKRFQ